MLAASADVTRTFFNRCANGLTVETTSWEDRFDGSTADGGNLMK